MSTDFDLKMAYHMGYEDALAKRMPEPSKVSVLGRGTCKVVSKPCDMWECECGKAWWHGGAPSYCQSCGRRVES